MVQNGDLKHELSQGTKVTEVKKFRIDRITGEIILAS